MPIVRCLGRVVSFGRGAPGHLPGVMGCGRRWRSSAGGRAGVLGMRYRSRKAWVDTPMAAAVGLRVWRPHHVCWLPEAAACRCAHVAGALRATRPLSSAGLASRRLICRRRLGSCCSLAETPLLWRAPRLGRASGLRAMASQCSPRGRLSLARQVARDALCVPLIFRRLVGSGPALAPLPPPICVCACSEWRGVPPPCVERRHF